MHLAVGRGARVRSNRLGSKSTGRELEARCIVRGLLSRGEGWEMADGGEALV